MLVLIAFDWGLKEFMDGDVLLALENINTPLTKVFFLTESFFSPAENFSLISYIYIHLN